MDEKYQFSALPRDVRYKLYDLLPIQDLLRLRQTRQFFFKDISGEQFVRPAHNLDRVRSNDPFYCSKFYYCLGSKVQVGIMKGSLSSNYNMAQGYSIADWISQFETIQASSPIRLFTYRADAVRVLKSINTPFDPNDDIIHAIPIFQVRLDIKKERSNLKGGEIVLNNNTGTVVYYEAERQYLTPCRVVLLNRDLPIKLNDPRDLAGATKNNYLDLEFLKFKTPVQDREENNSERGSKCVIA